MFLEHDGHIHMPAWRSFYQETDPPLCLQSLLSNLMEILQLNRAPCKGRMCNNPCCRSGLQTSILLRDFVRSSFSGSVPLLRALQDWKGIIVSVTFSLLP